LLQGPSKHWRAARTGRVDVFGRAALDGVVGWPSDGSMTGRVRSDEERTGALPM
jgi:hypothetical protein